MKVQFSACLLSAWLCCGVPVWAQTIENPSQTQTYSRNEFISNLYQADIIYLGETHDRVDHHITQLEILRSLYAENPNLAIGMEMFQRPYQEAIDRYLTGDITEAELLEQTEYETRWGFPWELYAPILDFAKTNGIPVIALNAPSEALRQVAIGGFDNISADYRDFVPPIEDLRTDNEFYRQWLKEIFDRHHQGHGSSDGFDRFFEAQVLWDETMADRIAQFLIQNPDTQMVVLAGQGHIIYGDGIPDRVDRRIPNLHHALVLFDPDSDLPSTPERPLADYIWRHDETSTP
ncbi:MAG: ChaN family lipoprotein [Cyanobacteria bacterium SID2]|nr:ChaN family lipoprotein [Cyanobacteria bacterium SID2]MBP0005529.1 ChaN family lipoprotein [Cyanobacteria bacterium SBC]